MFYIFILFLYLCLSYCRYHEESSDDSDGFDSESEHILKSQCVGATKNATKKTQSKDASCKIVIDALSKDVSDKAQTSSERIGDTVLTKNAEALSVEMQGDDDGVPE
jgi:hypothetical protein